MCARLEGLQIVNSFRIFIDLQSIDYFTVPPSFLCNYSVRFILTESNNEDMEGFNDVWANILNGDIINNSENISEHPSLAVNNKKFIEKKVDISATNQMMGDISVINNQEGGNKIDNVIVPNDLSKEEGEIFQEITSALNPEQKALAEKQKTEDVPKEETKLEETKEQVHAINIEEHNDSQEKLEISDMPSAIESEEPKKAIPPPESLEESKSPEPTPDKIINPASPQAEVKATPSPLELEQKEEPVVVKKDEVSVEERKSL